MEIGNDQALYTPRDEHARKPFGPEAGIVEPDLFKQVAGLLSALPDAFVYGLIPREITRYERAPAVSQPSAPFRRLDWRLP